MKPKSIWVLCIFSGFLVSSCTKGKNTLEIPSVLVSLDTLEVQSNGYISSADFKLSDVHGDSVAYIDLQQKALVIMDLESNKIVNTIFFENDGPNALGAGISSFYFGDSGQVFLIASENNIRYMDIEGKILKQLELTTQNELKQQKLEYLSITSACTLSEDNKFYCLYDSLEYRNAGLFVYDIENESYKVNPVNEISHFNSFDFPKMKFRPHISSFNNEIVISHPCTNEIIIWNKTKKSSLSKSFESKLTAKQQNFDNLNEDDILGLIQATRNQVQFKNILFDKKSNLYFRLTIDKEEVNSDEYYYTISIFDKNFNFISEVEIGNGVYTDLSFVYNGRLYLPQYSANENVHFLTVSFE
ncbi:MAG: DUF4221 family protein [Flavobacteriaceae bacterium]|nr:DUF4221 family protein [Flavobacteriaceae bacterium]